MVRVKVHGEYILTHIIATALSPFGQLKLEVAHPRLRGRRLGVWMLSSQAPEPREVAHWQEGAGGFARVTEVASALVASGLAGAEVSAGDLRSYLRDERRLQRETEWLMWWY